MGDANAGMYAIRLTYGVLGVGGAVFFANLFGVFGAAMRNRCLVVTVSKLYFPIYPGN